MNPHVRLLGKYELRELLGSGGMGEVWKALDTQLQRYVAIKLLQTNLQDDPSFVTRFQREAQVIASLHHPNIIQIFDFQSIQLGDTEKTICYMVMDYVEGQTLAQLIASTSRRGEFLADRDILQLFIALGKAIDYAHQKGMLHRDIKPANILLDKRQHEYLEASPAIGGAILSDFGIAKLMGNTTNTLSGWWIGTPHYTSPEQAKGMSGDRRSDIYALGIILYEICTGIRPFQGDNPAAILIQQINATPTAPALINPRITQALSSVILQSIAKNPEERFQTGTELAIALVEAFQLPMPEALRRPGYIHKPLPLQSPTAPGSKPSVPTPLFPGNSPLLTSMNNGAVSSSTLPVVSATQNISGTPFYTPSLSGTTSSFPIPEHVEGESLENYLEYLCQPLEEREVLLYAVQILDVLSYLEQKTPPVLHGDIRPATIIIGTKDKRAYLIRGGGPTIGYAPLEQLQSHPDLRSDLYGLAATIHHLLTNRNPSNQPPFVCPPARLLNSRISMDTERLLIRALNNNIQQRYQSANEMRQEIKAILLKHDSIAYNTQSGNNLGRESQADPGKVTPLVQTPYHTKHQKRRWLIPACIILLTICCIALPLLSLRNLFTTTRATASAPKVSLPNGIGVTKASNGEYIGISDGTFAFDTKRVDGSLKTQAAERLKTKDLNAVYSLWQDAVSEDTNDAETLIYQEDQRVMDSGEPYITFVVGTTLTGSQNDLAIGRECTQAAYIAQKEYNTASKLPGGIKVRLLLANYGSDKTYAIPVAKQVVALKQSDKTLVGTTGWTLNAVAVLSPSRIPLTANFGADAATNLSHYLFRVVSPASAQGSISAVYTEKTLHAKTAVVFVDSKSNFTLGLATDFTKRFTADGNTVLAKEEYTSGKTQTLPSLLKDALSKKPDVLFFAGGPGDASALLAQLQPTDPPLMGGSSLYQLGGYSAAARSGLSHLRFTAFSYPDEWEVLGLAAEKPSFFADYASVFDPNKQHIASPYGFDRPEGTTIELYDSISLILYAAGIALTENQQITPVDVQHALTEITGSKAFQGVSSQYMLGPDSNPIDRAVVAICVDHDDHFKFDGVYGKFLVGESYRIQFPERSACS